MNEEQRLSKRERKALRRAERQRAQQRQQRRTRQKAAALWIAVLLLIGGGAWALGRNPDRVGDSAEDLPLAAAAPGDWTKGGADPKVVLVEYSDFQCPACGYFFPIVQQLLEEFGDDLQLVYRHFPLRQIHPNAALAAQAAEAAGRQGKFWEMHDRIFAEQESWADLSRSKARDSFVAYAEQIGLDTMRFVADLESDAVREKVRRDEQSGKRARVRGTPTFFLNGERIQNPKNYDAFRNLIREQLP